MSRRPSPPPQLPGFTYLEPLGTGGFADVFLYEQQMPRRRVAVKVLLADRPSPQAAQEFADEANVMAMLSTHPAIVTIYQSGVAGDGRPYLVMEYCPRPNLQIRARKETFLVAEALRVGIQVAGAVETAHRAGVLHRDIKPANILVTEYNRPALTDFGIASTTEATGESSGMSIPWSPPESFAEPPQSGPRTDVWALGATLYTLLAGRSPFERPGERNSSADLIERIERAALPPLGRPDSPESLQRVLERAMAKNPDDRFPSAVAFARALQKVQIELSHSVTPIDIVDEHPAPEELEDDGDGLTRVRDVRSINPDSPTATRPSATTLRKQPGGAAVEVPRFDRPPQADALEATQHRAPAALQPDDDATALRPPAVVAPEMQAPSAATWAPAAPTGVQESPQRRRSGMPWWGWLIAVIGVVVVVGGIVLASSLTGALVPAPTPTTEAPQPQDPLAGVVPAPEDVTGGNEGGVVAFTWTNPAPEKGDTYIWYEVTLDGPGEPHIVEQTNATLEGERTGRTCIEVLIKRADGRSTPEPVRGCVG
ncbi:MAG: serine/threonine protein kinase [Microbacterium sp.]|uniref:non-specific serine/threonine protein kinase n=1 Tax=Microbacterium natoriense TaxID=284570 RepID=A0AAW8EWR4_9MICO|nr:MULTISPECIES: serine/threonine-protein kinase [Microbacterium]MBW8762992.1 serine/threonine protein kinase [Microbacterium sp.]MDQ0646832.1 serine/threonine protein kinase [Microbacterium natoriense]